MKRSFAFILVCFLSMWSSLVFAFECATPESEGISSQAVLDFISAVEKDVDALHGIVVVRDGKIISKGWWAPYRENNTHVLYSLSKSFTSTAIGLAVDEKKLKLDDKVVSYFPDETPADANDNLKNMRIRDLLCMGTGNHNDTFGAIKSTKEKNWAAVFLAQPVEHEPGTFFRYNTGATYMLSAILQKATGKTLVEYLEPRFFGPLGIKEYSWETDPMGINTGGYGLKVKTEDIARLGQLYLQKGMWEGKRILSEEWIAMATSRQIENGSNPESDWNQGYGFQFWMCRHNCYRGDGAFGQYCLVMPAQKAVIAINSGLGDMQKVLNLVWQHLLPAMKDGSLPENPDLYSELQKKLGTMRLKPVTEAAIPGVAGRIYDKEYILEPNEQDLKSVSVSNGNGRRYVKLVNAHGEQLIYFDKDKWVDGRIIFDKEIKKSIATTNGDQKIAASGGWQAPDHFRLMVYLIETPFRLQFDFKFSGDSLVIDLQQNVNFGPTKWHFKGKVESR